MANLINTQLGDTQNLLSYKSLLRDNPTINFSSSGVSSTGTISDALIIQKDALSFRTELVQNVVSGLSAYFDFGDALEYTATRNGNYTFSFYALKGELNVDPDYNVDVILKVYINSILTHTFTKNTPIEFGSLEDLRFVQSFDLLLDDVVNFEFQIQKESVGTPNPNIELFFTGFQLNYGEVKNYQTPYEQLTGWQQITDSTYKISSPLTILSGVTGKLLTGTVTEINTQLPTGVTTFWNNTTDKLMAVNNGDAFTLSLRFKAKMDVANGLTDVGINIGGALNVISQETLVFSKGSGVEQRFDIDLSYFTGTNFIANGGNIEITPLNGKISIYDIVLVIIRTHKGR